MVNVALGKQGTKFLHSMSLNILAKHGSQSLMKNINAAVTIYKEAFAGIIYGSLERIDIVKISALHFAQIVAVQGEEL